MRWFRRQPARTPGREPPTAPDVLLVCAACDMPLGDDPEDDPEGEAGLPLCGECNRARNFDLWREDVDDHD